MPLNDQGRPEVVALGGVVVDHVEDHLDPGLVHGLDHGLELLHLLAVRRVGRVVGVRSEEAERVVAPVVAQSLLQQRVVLHELVHRHQLDRGHAEPGQVLGDRGMGQPGVRAAHLLRYVGVQLGEALHVGLVDDRLVVGHVEPAVALPVEVRVGDDAERHVRAGVLVVAGVRARLEVVAEDRGVPVDLAVGGLGVGVEQQLGGVAAQPVRRLEGPVHAVAVALARLHVRQVAVPHVRVHLVDGEARLGAVGVDQAQLHPLGDLAEQREVRAAPVEGRAEGVGGAGPHVDVGSHWHDPITAADLPWGERLRAHIR